MEAALNTIIAKLENITSRLEAVEARGAGGAAPAASAAAGGGGGGGGSGEVAPAVAAFDSFISERLAPFVASSKGLGGDAAGAGAIVEEAFAELRKILVVASKSKQPDQATFGKLLEPLGKKLQAAQELKGKRTLTHVNHASTVAEGLAALSWVTVSPAPAPFVKESLDSAEFYGNKIRVEFKGKEQSHLDWVNGFKALLEGLQQFVKQHHTTGLVWNARGGDASAAAAGAGAGAPPPPPKAPGPPPPPPAGAPAGGAPAAPPTAALFAELSKGEAVTAGLKKVTRDMTNKDKQVNSVVSADAIKPKAAAGPKQAVAEKEYPPVLQLDGNKWKVEHQKGNKEVIVNVTSPKQVVYIYKCKDSVVKIVGKVNHITVDASQKTAVLFDDVVAAVEIVASKNVEIQANGKVPNMSVDNTDGCQIYWLDASNNECEVITSKSAEVNVSLKTGDSDEFTEFPIPQQFLSKFNAGKKNFSTETIKHE
jgi:adenylyl cyclase-associated protein